MGRRVWTVEDANGALGRVTASIRRARAVARDARRGNVETSPSSNGHAEPEDPTDELARIITDLGDDGIVVRDIDRGLVDFAAVTASGRPYWLCWVVGEPSVDWWHWPEDGFAGRTPLSEPPA